MNVSNTETILDSLGPIIPMGYVRFALEKVSGQRVPDTIALEWAEEAILTFCKNQYNVSVVQGTTTISVVSSNTGHSYQNDNTALGKGASCWNPDTVPAIFTSSPQTVSGVQYLSNSSTMSFCSTNWGWANDMVNRLSSLHAVTKTQDKPGDSWSGKINWTQSWASGGWKSSEDLQTLVRTQTLEEILTPLAASLNSLFNTRSEERAEGSYINFVTTVNVRWAWLTLPATMNAVGVVFLGVVMLGNKKRKSRLWKGSLLAVLYHGLDDIETRKNVERVSSMTDVAKATKVQLTASRSGQGARLALG